MRFLHSCLSQDCRRAEVEAQREKRQSISACEIDSANEGGHAWSSHGGAHVRG